MTTIRCTIPQEQQYELFYDAHHLNEKGRKVLSESLVPYLRGNVQPAHLPIENQNCLIQPQLSSPS